MATRTAAGPRPRGRTANKRVARLRIDTAGIDGVTAIARDGLVSARALLEVTRCRLTPWQVIQAASQDSTSLLRTITLEQLLLAIEATTSRTSKPICVASRSLSTKT